MTFCGIIIAKERGAVMEEKERALLVAVNVNGRLYFEESVEELKALTEACHMIPVDTVVQNLEKINNALYMGTGKVDEVKERIREGDIDLVIFNNELSPSQLRNLQKELDIPILDRTALILQIFAIRAQTKEAKMQVEIARLQYMVSRLVGLHESLGRQGGSAGVSNKGSGEKKLELDRRIIEDKITELNKELKHVVKEREVQRKQRQKSGLPLISLAGYTNAGKSTLLNAMVDIYQADDSKKVEEKDMLFATLETSVRNITLPDRKSFLLSDTVGFISELPHGLIKAFRSTLEEIKLADVILHVVDYADPNHEQQMEITKQTLKDLEADHIPVIYVYNKSDLVLHHIPKQEGDSIYLSAKEQIGIGELIEMIKSKVFGNYVKATFCIPYDKGNIISYLNQVATIEKTIYEEAGTIITVECKESDYQKYKEYEVVEGN